MRNVANDNIFKKASYVLKKNPDNIKEIFNFVFKQIDNNCNNLLNTKILGFGSFVLDNKMYEKRKIDSNKKKKTLK